MRDDMENMQCIYEYSIADCKYSREKCGKSPVFDEPRRSSRWEEPSHVVCASPPTLIIAPDLSQAVRTVRYRCQDDWSCRDAP